MAYEFEPACRKMEWLDPFYKQVWEKAYTDAIPISGTFELTPRCNFNCSFCYVHLKEKDISKYGQELTGKQWIEIAKQAKDEGTTWLCITGGEPLLHPDFEEIYTTLAKMGFFITLQTNGYLIKDKYIKIFEDYPPRGIKITLYGVSDETYQNVCRKENTELEGIRVEENIEKSKIEEIKYFINNPINIERKPCTYCKDYRLGYWITWNGKIRFCSFLNEPDISIKELSFKEAWQRLVEFEDQLDWPQECKECDFSKVCFKCAATLATNSGSVHKINKEYCKKIKDYYKKVKEEK